MADHSRARRVLETEAAAVLALVPRLDAAFDRAVDLLHHCRGRVVLTGVGKSGLIARKISGTLSSIGTPSFFLHAADAVHGDLGAVQADDVVVALSHSGETAELIRLLEQLRRLGARLIAITGAPGSTLAQAADASLDCSVSEEACPLNLVPTASTTAALAMGDALAMTVLDAKGIGAKDFASFHPGGNIGKRLMRVEHLMHGGDSCPRVTLATPMRDVIHEVSRGRLGMTCVVNASGGLVGVITDGDIRRLMARVDSVAGMTASDVTTSGAVTVGPAVLAVEALNIMEQRKITAVVVVDDSQRAAGVVHLHDLWRTELV
ncbi:MAG: KpsF/GutQ family sugar-phosphate isomerase [Vicinamibacterales bacterium]